MGMPHAVMKHWDPMLGCDIHMAVPPVVPPGPYPYFTMSFLSGLLVFFTPLKSQRTLYGITVAQKSDIGGGIAHIGPPSGDLAVTILTSGSKCHFGASSYQVDKKPVGLALGGLFNLNLNCGTPAPTPTGVVICINTHLGGMSWADLLGGVASLLADTAMQAVFNAIGNECGGGWTGAAVTFMLGTPLGPGIGNLGIKDQKGDNWAPSGLMPGTILGNLLENTGKAVGDILDGKPPHLPDPPDIRYPVILKPNRDPEKQPAFKPEIPNKELLFPPDN